MADDEPIFVNLGELAHFAFVPSEPQPSNGNDLLSGLLPGLKSRSITLTANWTLPQRVCPLCEQTFTYHLDQVTPHLTDNETGQSLPICDVCGAKYDEGL